MTSVLRCVVYILCGFDEDLEDGDVREWCGKYRVGILQPD